MDDTAAVATFLFTDIEGSTRLWEREPERMRPAMARHDALAREAVEAHAGELVKKTGDGLHAAFHDPLDALLAAVDIQLVLARLAQESGFELHARCGMHLGAFERRDRDYYGTAVNRAARIMAAAHGGQVLLSKAVAQRLEGRLPGSIALRDLGIARLRDLANPERIYQLVHPQLRSGFPALRSLEGTPNNLPHVPSTFIGRERELAEVLGLLGRTRLLTITGMGGLGKTRLALQAAAEAVDAYPDGVWIIELAVVHDPRRVAQAAAFAMGVKEEPGRPVIEALERHVRDRHLLVILDNCEHVVETSAELARRLLSAGASASVLATSREPLRIPGEVAYAIGGMSLPEVGTGESLSDSEAVRLFLDRAAAARPGFSLTAANAASLATICRDLDGIPLAIELAAARVRSLPVGEIAARVRDRFGLVTSRDPTALPRQRTLRALIDWSHDLLSEEERALFRQFAAFQSGCTLEAAEAVCELPAGNEVLPVLEQLVDKSLVLLDDDPPRYRMLETVRQYALERMEIANEGSALMRRHFDFYLALAELAPAGLVGEERARWLAILDAERENILAAHAWAQHGAVDARRGLRLASCMKRYWIERGLLELGERVTQEALERPGAREPDEDRCRALFDGGQLRYFMGRYREARRDLGESLAIARALGSPKKIGAVLQPLGMAALGEGDHELAGTCLREALELARSLDDARDIARAANVLGQLHRLEGAPHEAATLFEETIRISRAQGDREMAAVGALNLAMVSMDREEGAFAATCVREALEAAQSHRSLPLLKSALETASGLAAKLADDRAAARFYGAAEAQAQKSGLRRDPADAAFLAPLVERSRSRLGACAFAAGEAEGRALGEAEAAAEALRWLAGRPTVPAATCR